MTIVFIGLVVGGIGVGMLLAISGALVGFRTPPSAFHRWLPLPVVCVGPSCVTYARWSEAVARSGGEQSPLDILTALVDAHATTVVAYREGIRVSKAEEDQALHAVYTTLGGVEGGREFLEALYGANDRELREGVRALLLKEKLEALGVQLPWESRSSPSVTVWNVHLQWDPAGRTVVARTGGRPTPAGDGSLFRAAPPRPVH
jgi:hypothetical protein